MLAPDMSAGEAEHMPQAIRERHARLDLDVDLSAVDLELDRHGVAAGYCGLVGARRAPLDAIRRARSTMVPVRARR